MDFVELGEKPHWDPVLSTSCTLYHCSVHPVKNRINKSKDGNFIV